MTIRFILGYIFMGLGVLAYIISVIGNFKFKYILNRMHAAGIGDSFALGCFMIGCIIINGINVTSLKLLAAGVCLYFTSPVCSHMLAKLEHDLNADIEKECEVEKECRS